MQSAAFSRPDGDPSRQNSQHYRESEASCGESDVFSRAVRNPGRGGCQGGLQEAPGIAGGRPEAAGRVDFDPRGKIRGYSGPGAPKHRKYAYKSGGPKGGSGGPNVRVPVGKPTLPPSRFGRSDGLGVRNPWVCTCFPTCLATRSGRPNSTPSGAEGLAGAHPVDSIRPESNPDRQICVWPRNPVLRPCGPPRVRPLLPEKWPGSRPAGHCSPREDFVRPDSNPNSRFASGLEILPSGLVSCRGCVPCFPRSGPAGGRRAPSHHARMK